MYQKLEQYLEEKLIKTITTNQKSVKVPLHSAKKNLVMRFRITKKESHTILKILDDKGVIERDNSNVTVVGRSPKDLLIKNNSVGENNGEKV
jgi:hypothetical protein